MGKQRDHTATVEYAFERASNWTVDIMLGDRDSIVGWASERVAEMRSAGAVSDMRTVTVKRSDDEGRELGLPPIMQASYYDDEQGLSEVERYTSRVHDWHSKADQRNTMASMGPAEYVPWQQNWGPAPPAECPGCNARLDPQNFYKYNGHTLVRTDGTRRLLGS